MKKYYLVGLISLFLLQACSTTEHSAALNQGQVAFNKQDYHVAFSDLLPVAQKGNPDAQYAVGYMYYNGLGVDKDFNSAQFWFHSAADQGNVKAQKALAMIKDAAQSELFPAPPGFDAMEQSGNQL